jgi:hypothetical protein
MVYTHLLESQLNDMGHKNLLSVKPILFLST